MERTWHIGKYEINLLARDQYNDYSVRYDYSVRVIHTPTGKMRVFPVGSAGPTPSDRVWKAVETAKAWAVREACTV